MSGGGVARARLAGVGRFLAALLLAAPGVVGAFALAEEQGGWAPLTLALTALVAAGVVSGRWSALAIPFVLACVVAALRAGEALVEGQLFEPSPDGADPMTNAALAVVGLILGLLAAIPATMVVAVGILTRRLAARAWRSRREGVAPSARRARWWPSESVVFALAASLVLGGTGLAATLTGRPPPTSGGSSPAPSIACSGTAPFEAYYVGSTFGGLPLDEATRSCDAGGLEGSVHFEYSDCDSCRQIPLEVSSLPLCEGLVEDPRSLKLIGRGEGGRPRYYRRTRILGAPAIEPWADVETEHPQVEVYTGNTVISVRGSSRGLVESAARALRRAPGSYVPLEGSGPLAEFEPIPAPPLRRLRPPPPGLFEGKVCTAIADERKKRLERKREGRRRGG